ncbi:MAG: hypothetical protein VX278_22295, partial [Myxococcota bacterium]|nr:hypothetical protein [Myxococcota bacterium]
TSEPSSQPESSPTAEPTNEPTNEPASQPSNEPSEEALDADPYTSLSFEVQPDGYGYIDIPIQLSSEATNVLFSLRGADDIVISEVISPQGQLVFDWRDWDGVDQSYTYALYVSQSGDCFFNWPIRAEDAELYEGEWLFSFYTFDASPPANLDVDLQIKQDTSYTSGTLDVTIGYTEDVGYTPNFQTTLNEAVAEWERIYSLYGLSITVSTNLVNIPDTLPSPFIGDVEYYTENIQGSDQDILIVIGDTIDGHPTLLGMSGSVPGPTTEAESAVVAISWLNAGGADGVFDSIDTRMLGETFAHEVGHYIGLPHPVESSWSQYDALSDTPQCSDAGQCEGLFQSNLMFPYPVCGSQDCVAQDELTAGQQGVAHRYTGVY